MELYNQSAACFGSNPDDFDPIFWSMVLSDWALDFLDAMELLRTGMGVVVQSSKGEGLVGPSADSRR
jgi:hypothetical protein